jgi:hypothetical protein
VPDRQTDVKVLLAVLGSVLKGSQVTSRFLPAVRLVFSCTGEHCACAVERAATVEAVQARATMCVTWRREVRHASAPRRLQALTVPLRVELTITGFGGGAS